MTDREKLIELLGSTKYGNGSLIGKNFQSGFIEKIADQLLASGVTVQPQAIPMEDWDEDYGDVLWWKFPIEEPPYVGSPLDVNWPDYHTHWTPILVPQPPREG